MDLVIEITLNNRDLKYIVIEMKVDTIAKEDQLTATYDGFHSSEDAIFILFCLALLKFVRFQNMTTLILSA